MTEREKILGRVREALRAPAPRHGHHHDNGAAAPAAASVLRSVGPTFEERVEAFRAAAADLKAAFHLVADEEELRRRLKELSRAENWGKIASHSGELTGLACDALALPVCQVNGHYDVHEMEACDAGITECDALVARTGSVLVTARSAGGRAISALPPHHVVLARRSQLIPGLPEAYALLRKKYAPNFPSFISIITGPSRTGDIERILVLGAHGPKKLTIFCI